MGRVSPTLLGLRPAGDRAVLATSLSATEEDLWHPRRVLAPAPFQPRGLLLRSDQWFSSRVDLASQGTLGNA